MCHVEFSVKISKAYVCCQSKISKVLIQTFQIFIRKTSSSKIIKTIENLTLTIPPDKIEP